jgi:hypothetical protein
MDILSQDFTSLVQLDIVFSFTMFHGGEHLARENHLGGMKLLLNEETLALPSTRYLKPEI